MHLAHWLVMGFNFFLCFLFWFQDFFLCFWFCRRYGGFAVLVGGGFSSILWFAKRWRQSGKVGFTDGEKEEGWWKKAAAVGGRWVCACLYGVVILSRSVYRHFGTKAKMLKIFFFFYQNFKRLNILYKISIFILIFYLFLTAELFTKVLLDPKIEEERDKM